MIKYITIKMRSNLEIEKYLQTDNISYYKKQMPISYYPNNLEKYNLLLKKASDEETIKSLNEKVLKEVVKSEFQN